MGCACLTPCPVSISRSWCGNQGRPVPATFSLLSVTTTGGSDVLFQTSDTTWQAYNVYGGSSLYSGPNGRAYKVSYNRPLSTRQGQCCIGSIQSYFFSAEYPMVRWLERNGYDISYSSGVDRDRRGNAAAGTQGVPLGWSR